MGRASFSPQCTPNQIHALLTITLSSFSLDLPTHRRAASPKASYLALAVPCLDVHAQGVGHWDIPMIVEGHKVEGGYQVMVHKHGD